MYVMKSVLNIANGSSCNAEFWCTRSGRCLMIRNYVLIGKGATWQCICVAYYF